MKKAVRNGATLVVADPRKIWLTKIAKRHLQLMTGHLGYESTGLNALRGQNNVQGLNDAGANPAYLPGYQSVGEPQVRRKFADAWGVEVPTTPGYRLDQIMSGLHDGRVRA